MQDLLKKDSDLITAHSTPPCIIGCTSWWTSTESQIQQSSLSNNLTLKMATLPSHCQSAKELNFQFQDQDSSSTQSTGQSYPEVASVGESSPNGHNIITMQSGYNGTQGKPEDGHTKSALSMGTQDYVLPPQVDYRQPFACIPLSYPDPYFSEILSAYGPQAPVRHPQMMGMESTRVPLPLDLAQGEPIYVNAKQYRAILRRRKFRAKLDAQRKLPKVRKPYLHESRHIHALKRVRGSGGRFVNTKKLQELNADATTNGRDALGSVAQLHTTKKLSESKVHRLNSINSCSNITSASNRDNIFHQQEFGFSVYGGPTQGGEPGGMPGGTHHYLSVPLRYI